MGRINMLQCDLFRLEDIRLKTRGVNRKGAPKRLRLGFAIIRIIHIINSK